MKYFTACSFKIIPEVLRWYFIERCNVNGLEPSKSCIPPPHQRNLHIPMSCHICPISYFLKWERPIPPFLVFFVDFFHWLLYKDILSAIICFVDLGFSTASRGLLHLGFFYYYHSNAQFSLSHA